MQAIITAIGMDKVGIVHEISGLINKYNMNIVNINQEIMEDYFTMIIIVNIDNVNAEFDEVVKAFEELGDKLKIEIKIQHEDIFKAMHRI